MEEAEPFLGDWRSYMQMLVVFAVAVFLAGIGIYGVMLCRISSANIRTTSASVWPWAPTRGTFSVGCKTGILTDIDQVWWESLALGLTRLISTFLFGVKPTDPLTYLLVTITLT